MKHHQKAVGAVAGLILAVGLCLVLFATAHWIVDVGFILVLAGFVGDGWR